VPSGGEISLGVPPLIVRDNRPLLLMQIKARTPDRRQPWLGSCPKLRSPPTLLFYPYFNIGLVSKMLLQGLPNTSSLEVFHFPTLEEFRSFERLSEPCVLPLTGHSSSARARIKLSNCSLVVQRTFPRILEMKYETDGMLCFIPLTPFEGFKINGAAIGANTIITVRGQADCHIVEPQASLLAIVDLDSTTASRFKPDASAGVQLFQADNFVHLQTFRTIVASLVAVAAQRPQDLRALREMEGGLLCSLEGMMSACSTALPPATFRRYLPIVELIDEYMQFHPDACVGSTELASYCGVSSRTLQNATKSVRGTSVHRYLRLRKLWSVRRTLTVGRPDTVISDVARANGFRHMGEFTGAYRSTFGETASTTLARHQ
jgi:AraC-like DNA-binding protein